MCVVCVIRDSISRAHLCSAGITFFNANLAGGLHRAYTSRVLDVKLIRDRANYVRARLATRGAGDETKVDEILQLDEQWRRLIAEIDALRSKRNQVSKQIGILLGQNKTAEAEARKTEARQIGDQIAALEKQVAEIESARRQVMLRLPNLPHESVKTGKSAEDNIIVREYGKKPHFDFRPWTHLELCESLGLVDFARGVKLSGSGFVLFTDMGARLERSLIQFMLELHTRQHGYIEIWPPLLVGSHCLEGVGQFPKFEDQYYAVREGTDNSTLGKLYLIPTAETPLANIHRDEILAEGQLPICYCAYTPCFRSEAGAAGVSTRGMIRVHQFDKVELVKIVKPEHGYDELEKMVNDAERVLQLLGLHYRVVELCTGDLGFASAKTYDIEVWAAGQGSYLEVSSVSNCEDFQARRMNLRYKSATGENRFPHILNGSGTALARLFVALIEQYQQADGTVVIPEPLRQYMGVDRLTR